MKLTVLGSNASSPSPLNPASGYLVEAGEATIWMDCGPGTFMALSRWMDPADVSAVIVSHTHVDHCADIVGLSAYLAYGLGTQRPPVPVYAPVGSRDHIAAFVRAEAGGSFDAVLQFHEVGRGDEVDIGDVVVRFGDAVHPVPSNVIRLDSPNHSLTYSGDTGPGGDLIELATGSDVLLCEATLQGSGGEEAYPHHLTAFEAGEVASAAGVGELILTHIPMRHDPQLSIDQASAAFVGPPISYAAPNQTFTWEQT